MKTAQEGYIVGASAAGPTSKTAGPTVAEYLSQRTEHLGDWPNAAGFNAPNETRDAVELKVTGEFPLWTAGTLLRAGPGASSISRSNPSDGTFNVSHWFDGFAHLHKFEILPTADGNTKVFYQSRSHVDEAIEEARRTGKLSGITFGQKRDPCDTLYKKVKTMFQPINTGGAQTENINVVIQPTTTPRSNSGEDAGAKSNTMTVTSDKSSFKSFSLETLEPLGVASQTTLHPTLKGPLSGAHSCIDQTTGETYNYNLELGKKTTYRIFSTSPTTGQTRILATISDPKIKGAYIHSMLMTEHYIILCIWPAYYTSYGASILWSRNILDAIAPFDPSQKCTWFVIDRLGDRGVLKKFTSPGMFCFHTVNAWEEVDPETGTTDILAELCTFKNTNILHKFYYENLVSNRPGAKSYSGPDAKFDTSVSLSRYRLAAVESARPSQSKPSNPKTMQSEQAQLLHSLPSPLAGDLPTINTRYATRQHRYVYSVIDTGRSSFVDAIGKTDTLRKTCEVWREEGCTPGEVVFVPRPMELGSASEKHEFSNDKPLGEEAEEEDEDTGTLLSVVLNGHTGRSFLLALDAKTLTEVGRADVDSAVGIGFHGVHLSSEP